MCQWNILTFSLKRQRSLQCCYCSSIHSVLWSNRARAVARMSTKTGIEFVKQVAKYVCEGNGFDRLLKTMKVVSGGNGRCLVEYTVDEGSVNSGQTLHGGLTATLVDTVTSMALMTAEAPPGVSVNLNVNYLKAAKIGDTVEIDARTVKAGKTLAYLSCELRLKCSGEVIATGTHTKFIGTSKKLESDKNKE